MNVEHPDDSGLVANIPVQPHRELRGQTRHGCTIQVESSFGTGHLASASPRTGLPRRWLWQRVVDVRCNAASFLRWLKPRAAFCDCQKINRNFLRLTMDLQLEPVCEKRPQHRTI